MATYKIGKRTCQAVQWTANMNQTELPVWFRDLMRKKEITIFRHGFDDTLRLSYDGKSIDDGRFTCVPGSWIIRYGNGIINYLNAETFKVMAVKVDDDKPTLKLSDAARARVQEEMEAMDNLEGLEGGMTAQDLGVLLQLHDQVHGLTEK